MQETMYLGASNGVPGYILIGTLIDPGADVDRIRYDVASLDLDIDLKAKKAKARIVDHHGCRADKTFLVLLLRYAEDGCQRQRERYGLAAYRSPQHLPRCAE